MIRPRSSATLIGLLLTKGQPPIRVPVLATALAGPPSAEVEQLQRCWLIHRPPDAFWFRSKRRRYGFRVQVDKPMWAMSTVSTRSK